jgi:DNA-binding transcriptional LysR family regulator
MKADVPASLFPCKTLRMRFRGLAGCNLQIYGYTLEADFDGAPLQAFGATDYVQDGTDKVVARIKAPTYYDEGYGALVPGGTDAYDVWTASSGWKIPRGRGLPLERAAGVSLRTAQNEAEAVQLVVRPRRDVKDLRVTASVPGIPADVLRVGYVKGYERTDLSQMVRDFARANPGVAITFLRENVVDLYDALRAERIDVAINIKYLGSDDLMAGIEWQVLRTYPLVAMLPFGHPLAGHRTVTLEELRAYPIVQHNFARDDYGEFARIDRIVSDARLMDRASCVSCMGWDIETSVLCVAAGFGYALVPGYYTQRILASEQVVAVPVEGLEQEIVVVAAWMPHTQNELIDVFLDEFLSVG